ncbi:MAG TPA: hypothetical protein VNK23_00345 [Candidatus Dormibacteraeota bacterium]|nr:hypothetical protein [Candidatus Dormibacteraeota bacterium]
MSAPARHYGDEPSRPIPVWNGILDHQVAIGPAIWVFLWCLDKITDERDGIGYVLGGAPIKIGEIAAELKRSPRSVKRDIGQLKTAYLQLRRTPYGYVIGVLNSKKFGIWRPWRQATNGPSLHKETGQKCPISRPKMAYLLTKNGPGKEDPAVDPAIKAAARPLAAGTSTAKDSVWNFLGIEHCGELHWRSFLESRWASRNGDSPAVLLGETVDAWVAASGTPRSCGAPFFRALAKLRSSEPAKPSASAEVHRLTAEEIPV